MKLSIIIVNWNTSEMLLDCLASIYHHGSNIDFEIWVVDNNSTDESRSLILEEFPQVELIENQDNVGFAAANNQAMKASTSEYVLIINPDTLIGPGSIDGLVSFLDKNPHAGAAGPLIMNPDGSLQPSCSRYPTLLREFWRLFHLDDIIPLSTYPMTEWDLQTPRNVEVLLGACILLRRHALDQVGLLDRRFFMYSEEIDLCFRLRQSGWRIYWIPDASIIHFGGQSTRQVSASMFMELYRSKVQFFRKHYNPATVWAYKCVLGLASLTRIGLGSVFGKMPIRNAGFFQTTSMRYKKLLSSLPGM